MTNNLKHLVALSTLCVLLLFGLNACNQQKEMTTIQPERSFVMGSGGGITGKFVTYKVYNSGKIELLNDESDTFTYLKTIPRDSAKATFKTLDTMNLESVSFNHPNPGGMSYFIELENEGHTNKIAWGNINEPFRNDVEKFFKRTRRMILADYP